MFSFMADDPTPALDATHQHFAPHLHAMTAKHLQALLFDAIEDGPETLIEPIEAELKRRGADPYGNLSADR